MGSLFLRDPAGLSTTQDSDYVVSMSLSVAWGFARGADMRGFDVIQHCEVTGIKREKGNVVGVETSKGFIGCKKIGLAAAGNSTTMAKMASISRARVLRSWGGTMDMSMDGSPIIDNLYLNAGWCYGGFKATPAFHSA
jgi:glycine/D-amino acid oxidase-like deaminating enzyme